MNVPGGPYTARERILVIEDDEEVHGLKRLNLHRVFDSSPTLKTRT